MSASTLCRASLERPAQQAVGKPRDRERARDHSNRPSPGEAPERHATHAGRGVRNVSAAQRQKARQDQEGGKLGRKRTEPPRSFGDVSRHPQVEIASRPVGDRVLDEGAQHPSDPVEGSAHDEAIHDAVSEPDHLVRKRCHGDDRLQRHRNKGRPDAEGRARLRQAAVGVDPAPADPPHRQRRDESPKARRCQRPLQEASLCDGSLGKCLRHAINPADRSLRRTRFDSLREPWRPSSESTPDRIDRGQRTPAIRM